MLCFNKRRNCSSHTLNIPNRHSIYIRTVSSYSHRSNKRGVWNKRGGGAKFAKSLNMEVGINMEGGIFWKKLVHNSNKRGVEGGKI